MLKPITDLVTGCVTIDPADPEVLEVLGTVCFVAGPIAHVFQRAGYDVPKKAEAEQGAVILWMLSLKRDHGKDWREKGDEILRGIIAQEKGEPLVVNE